MPGTFWAFAVTAFLTVVLFVWGVYSAWVGNFGLSPQLLARRLPSRSPPAPQTEALAVQSQHLLSTRPWAQRLLRQWPSMLALDRFLQQTGLHLQVGPALLIALAWVGTALTLAAMGRVGALGATALVGLGLALPLGFMQWKRRQRIAHIDSHLPEVLELMARAMQAGHAFNSALLMAAKDTRPPLAAELQQVFDEVHYGLDLRQALSGLAARVASDDLRFFVIAVLIQHETGGNLAEILQNTASLIRERQKLRGVIRVLSGEGRVSAWILSLLPFALAAVLNLINPEFMSALWTTPQGLQMVAVCLVLMVLGVAWMWRLIDIRI
jgi:tight adherence protein B